MSIDEECPHLLNPAWCADCNGTAAQQRADETAERDRVLALEGWRESKYGGNCASCGSRFEEGTPIRRKTRFDSRKDGPPNFVASCCAPAGDPA